MLELVPGWNGPGQVYKGSSTRFPEANQHPSPGDKPKS